MAFFVVVISNFTALGGVIDGAKPFLMFICEMIVTPSPPHRFFCVHTLEAHGCDLME